MGSGSPNSRRGSGLRVETSLVQAARADIERKRPRKRQPENEFVGGPSKELVLWLIGAYGIGLLLVALLAPLSEKAAAQMLVLWQVQTAVAVIAPPLLLLVVEFARSDERPGLRRAEVLRGQSGLLPTAGFALAGVVLDGVASALPASLWGFYLGLSYLFVTLLFVIWTYVEVLRLVFEARRVRLVANQLVKADIASSVRKAAERRLAKSRLEAFLAEIGAELWYFGTEVDPVYLRVHVPLVSDGTVRITDVNPRRLVAVLERLPRRALDAESAKPSRAQAEGPASERHQSTPIRLSRTFGDPVGPDAPLVVSFSREFFGLEDDQIADLSQDLKQAFRTTRDTDYEAENLRLKAHLEHLRDRTLECLGAGLARQAEDQLEDYRGVLESFLEERSAYAAAFGEQLVPSNRLWLRSDWDELKWLREDLRSFMYQATSSSNAESTIALLGFVQYLAVSAIRPAGSALPDFDSFRQLVMNIPAICSMPDRHGAAQHSLIVNHAALLLTELGLHWIEPRLKEAATAEEGRMVERCWLALLAAFSSCLKTAFDAGHVRDFETFADALAGMAEQAGMREPWLDDEEQRPLGFPDIAGMRARMLVAKDLAFAGLDAWILSRYVDGYLSSDSLVRWRSLVPRASSVPSSWSVALQAVEVQNSPGDPFGWGWWEANVRPGRIHVHAVRFGSLILQAWCLNTLELLDEMVPEVRSQQVVDPVRELPFWTEPQGDLSVALNQFERLRAYWAPHFGSGVAELAGTLRSLLDESAAKQKRQEDDTVINAPLSGIRIAELHERIVTGWLRNATLRLLIRGELQAALESGAAEDGQGLWIDQLDRKEPYIDQPLGGATYFEWGDRYGRSMAVGENRKVVAAIARSDLIPHSVASPGDRGLGAVKAAIERRRSEGRGVVVVAVGLADVMMALNQTAGYARDAGPDGRLGFLDEAPVYHVLAETPAWVLVGDIRRLGKWMQYPPDRRDGDFVLGGVLGVSVETFDDASAGALLAAQPDLFSSKPDLLPEEKTREVLKSVRLRANERFEFEVVNPSEAEVIELPASHE